MEARYLAPPAPDTVRLDASGVVLSGHAPAGAKVRLAEPTGRAVFAQVDAQGRWTLPLGPSTEPRIFGLSAVSDGRTGQAEGYVVVTPRGRPRCCGPAARPCASIPWPARACARWTSTPAELCR
jgi:hypothetical protein